jgi:hypothetical protein
VTDPTGAVVPNAAVVLKGLARSTHVETKTNAVGAYTINFMEPGNYTLTISASGFATTTREVIVEVNRVTTANVQLGVARAVEAVTVTAPPPLITTSSANVATTIGQTEVAELPNPGNDITYIAQTSPGAVMNTQSGYGNFSVNGMPATSNLFTINGMQDNDPFLNLNNSGATNLMLGQNEVQEVTVVNNGYTAQYGVLAGSNVNYVTKSGSNSFHGDVNYYWNGRAMNANSFLNNSTGTPRPFTNSNQWGADVGGPIVKNKLFFYFNTEGIRFLLPTSESVLVPTAQFEQATLQNLASMGMTDSARFYKNKVFPLFDNAPGHSRAVTTPGGGCSNFAGTAVPGIGTFGDPAAGNIPCTDSYRSTAGNISHEQLLSFRMDYNPGSKDTIFGRVENDHGLQATYTDPFSKSLNALSDQPEWQGQLNWTHTFGPTSMNQFVLGTAYYSAIFLLNQGGLATFPTTLDTLDGSLGSPVPFLGGTGLGGETWLWPQGRNVTQYQFSDDFSKLIGRHSIKFGGEFRRFDSSDHDYGIFTAGAALMFSLDDFYNGGTTGSELIQNFPTLLNQPMAYYSVGGYFSDDWRARKNLLLTFALRADHPSDPVCQHNCFSRLTAPFVGASHNPNQPYNQAMLSNQVQALSGLNSVTWSPRFGFAWQPLGVQHNTVIRGGIGIFYDLFPATLVDDFSENPPEFIAFAPLSVGPPAAMGWVPSESCPSGSGCVINEFAAASALMTAFSQGFAKGQNLSQIVGGLSPALQSVWALSPAPPALTSSDAMTHTPQYQKWSLGIEQQIGANSSVSATYVGTHGVYLLTDNNSINAYGFGSLPATAPDPRFGEVSFYTNAGVSRYNGVTLAFTHRFTRWTHGFIKAYYTWGHSLDTVSNGGLLPFAATSTDFNLLNPQNPYNTRGMYGNADYDVRHSFNLSYVWEPPIKQVLLFGHGPDRLLKGWQVSGTLFARSGLPFTVVDESTGPSITNYHGTILATYTGSGIPSCGKAAAGANGTPCLNVNNFTAPILGNASNFGSQERNQFRGPGYFDTDFSIMKFTPLDSSEKVKLGIGFQFYNFFNHANFDLPVANVASPQFGTLENPAYPPTCILGAFLGGDCSPRMIQLKATLQF